MLYDDRTERAGIKLNDMDLIGIPIRVVVGKKSFANSKVEISLRMNRNEKESVYVDEVMDYVLKLREILYAKLNNIREA